MCNDGGLDVYKKVNVYYYMTYVSVFDASVVGSLP